MRVTKFARSRAVLIPGLMWFPPILRLSSPARAAKLRGGRRVSEAQRSQTEETSMAMHIGHVHIKTKDDHQKVAKFYVDNFGATVKREIPGRGCQLDVAGVHVNDTTLIEAQKHQQNVELQHISYRHGY